ncbi:MAG TPA: endolytic transglycosylase MltG, partial [candidate division Zixibacteria bacterium]|nr:endolytic transglycosylase MltG [candidate division Zixibacteria bacterium]
MSRLPQNAGGVRWYEYPFAALVGAGFVALAALIGVVWVAFFSLRIIVSRLRNMSRAALAFLVVVLIGLCALWVMYTDSVDLGDRVVSVTVEPEMTFAAVVRTLDSAGALERPWLFKLAARISGVDRRLWVGRYDFTGAVSPRSLLEDFREGNVATFSLTLPEGLTIARAAGVIAAAFDVDSAEVAARCYDTALCRERFGLDNL